MKIIIQIDDEQVQDIYGDGDTCAQAIQDILEGHEVPIQTVEWSNEE